MEIIPVLEIRAGKSARLMQQRADLNFLRRGDPLQMALLWKNEGALRLHIHDIDSVRVGMPQNRDIVRDIVRRTGLAVSYSGGVRTPEIMSRVISWGVDRVVADTCVVHDVAIRDVLGRLQDRAALDIRDNDGTTRYSVGRPPDAAVGTDDLLRRMWSEQGWQRFVWVSALPDRSPGLLDMNRIYPVLAAARKPVTLYARVVSYDQVTAIAAAGVDSLMVADPIYDLSMRVMDLIHIGKHTPVAPGQVPPGVRPGMPPRQAGLAPSGPARPGFPQPPPRTIHPLPGQGRPLPPMPGQNRPLPPAQGPSRPLPPSPGQRPQGAPPPRPWDPNRDRKP